jgi:hypothetical protein
MMTKELIGCKINRTGLFLFFHSRAILSRFSLSKLIETLWSSIRTQILDLTPQGIRRGFTRGYFVFAHGLL